jgi:hypothetical protein
VFGDNPLTKTENVPVEKDPVSETLVPVPTANPL